MSRQTLFTVYFVLLQLSPVPVTTCPDLGASFNILILIFMCNLPKIENHHICETIANGQTQHTVV